MVSQGSGSEVGGHALSPARSQGFKIRDCASADLLYMLLDDPSTGCVPGIN